MGKGKSGFHMMPSVTGQSELILLPLKEASSRVETEDPGLTISREYLCNVHPSVVSTRSALRLAAVDSWWKVAICSHWVFSSSVTHDMVLFIGNK